MALLKCCECGNNVSDRAIACPQCGCPINLISSSNTEQNAPRRKPKYRRLPNGYGNIRFLGGKRRKPYAVYPPTNGYLESGSAITRNALGYFETYQEALTCLANYNLSPYNVKSSKLTFAEVYQMYYNDKFSENSKRKYSDSMKRNVRCGFNNLSDIHNTPIKMLKTDDMQRVLDESTLKHASLEPMMAVMKSVCKFALQKDFIQKDYSQFLQIKSADDDEKGIPFTESDIETLWSNVGKYDVDIILIMIYTGFRISELENLEINRKEKYFKGGIKTASGKNRIVPFHERIVPLVYRLEEKPFKARNFRDKYFYQALNQLGLNEANNGVKHTPHDCRHTFSWIADKYKMDSLSKHMIMGHSTGSKDIEETVYGHRTLEELRTEINKIK